jgi:uncharacterized membrane protein YtjA (UPF0391 family)
MKYYVAVFTVISFTTAVLGFGILSGPAALVCRIVFIGSFIGATFCLARIPRVRKPVHSSFAASFKPQSQEPASGDLSIREG